MTFRKGCASLLVLGLLAVAVAGAQGSVTDATRPAATTGGVDDETLIRLSDSVAIWERAGLPLRARTPGATRITNANLFVNVDEFNTGDVPLNKRQLDVYDTGDRIQLSLDPDTTGAGTGDFAGKEAQLLVANVQDNRTARTVIRQGGLQSSAAGLLAGTDENVTYHLLDDAEGVDSFDSEGGLSAKFTPSESGVHVFAAVYVKDGAGFSVEDGDASVDGNVTIVGVDSALVQRARADVSPERSRISPGDSVTFDVDANVDDGEDVTHAVMLYRRSTFVSQRFTFAVDEVSRTTRSENVTIEHSLDRINGVGDVQTDLDVMGIDISDRRVTPSVELPGLVDFVATKLAVDSPNTVSTGDASLDASVTAVETDGAETEVTVETLGNWSTGRYQFVYIAEGEGPAATATTTGRIQVTAGEGDSGGNGGQDDDSDGGGMAGGPGLGNQDDTDDDESETDGDGTPGQPGQDTQDDAADETTPTTERGGQPSDPGSDAVPGRDDPPGQDDDDQGTAEAAADPGTETGTETSTGFGPGFGLVAGMVALLAATVLATRRQ